MGLFCAEKVARPFNCLRDDIETQPFIRNFNATNGTQDGANDFIINYERLVGKAKISRIYEFL